VRSHLRHPSRLTRAGQMANEERTMDSEKDLKRNRRSPEERGTRTGYSVAEFAGFVDG
jgi:hypothetical protein